MAQDGPVLPVHRHAWEVAHMLPGAGELVEQRGLAAVLVAHKGIGEGHVVGQGLLLRLVVGPAVLAQAGVGPVRGTVRPLVAAGAVLDGIYGDLLRLGQAEGQLIAVDLQLHGVAHGGQLDHRHLRPGHHSHIQKVLAQGTVAPHLPDHGAFSNAQFS